METRKSKTHKEPNERCIDRYYILSELIARDPRVDKMVDLIMRLTGESLAQPERSDIETEIQQIHEKLSLDYSVVLGKIPDVDELKELESECWDDLNSGATWLTPQDEQILEFLDQNGLGEIKSAVREQLPSLESSLSGKAQIDDLVGYVISALGIDASQGDEPKDWVALMRLAVSAVMNEIRAEKELALSDAEKSELIARSMRDAIKNSITRIHSGYRVLQTRRNWVAPGERRLVKRPDGTWHTTCSEGEPPPPGEPPTILIAVDPSKVFLVGYTKLAEEFQTSVRAAMSTLPDDWISYPEELAFLRTISVEHFERDLRRYDLYVKEGLNYRQVALLEEQERQGKPIPLSVQKIRVGKSISGEDGVEKSVKSIWLAIHREPYWARRRRIDEPAKGMDAYACPEHTLGNCDSNCAFLKDFMKRFNASAATENTGRGKLTYVDGDELFREDDYSDDSEDFADGAY